MHNIMMSDDNDDDDDGGDDDNDDDGHDNDDGFQIMKVLSKSDDQVLALGASFSPAADSHLVCLQNDDGNYQTQAINIQNRPRQGQCHCVVDSYSKELSRICYLP